MGDLVRYSLITEKMPREFILLQGNGCIWKKCIFCDYYNDVSNNPFSVNKPVIDMITGETGTLDVINSGSAMELDRDTVNYLRKKVKEKSINTLWFEAHWLYRDKLLDFSKNFPECNVKYRIGVETFDKDLSLKLKKGIGRNVTPKEISKYFKGACLLVGFEGQTKEIIENDINIALQYFEYFSVNVFVENSTGLKRDSSLVEWFIHNMYPKIKDNPKIEVLINNTDLGVG